ncbi:eCIS core domain-containing protein [Micromonospora sp. BQ11]|uniref:eCIS core domain-containing protein n=1 Tax=Micromonospora sp. BQ11 TaxID=3452212 RepID=UPI003F8A0F03
MREPTAANPRQSTAATSPAVVAPHTGETVLSHEREATVATDFDFSRVPVSAPDARTPRPAFAPALRHGVPSGRTVASPTDPLEHEGHAAADRIAGFRPTLPASGGSAPPVADTSGLGAGRPLDAPTRQRFERELGTDLSSVRIHTDAAAARSSHRMGAAAYAVDNHIVFGDGGFAPSTDRGTWLLAHELTHVVQHAVHDQDDVVHRAPEDVPRLEQQLFEGVAAGGDDGYLSAARALNQFAPDDITRLLSDHPGKGRKALTPAQIASIHLAARNGPGLGPDSNAATFTRPAYLDKNIRNEMDRNNWEGVAEYLNGFNKADIMKRLRRMTIEKIDKIRIGALNNKALGVNSAVFEVGEEARRVATQALIDQEAGPGAIKVTGSLGGGSTGVPVADQQMLDPGTDGRADPLYIDNNIVNASYDVLTGLFQVEYQGGGYLDLDFDAVLKGAKATSGLVDVYFKHRKNGRVYPAVFTSRDLPNISACALAIEAKIPEAQARVIDAMIDVAVSAAGVAGAVIRGGQAATRSAAGAAKPAAKTDQKAAPSQAGRPGTATGSGGSGPSGSGGGQQSPQGMSASGSGKGGAPAPKAGGRSGGGQLQEVPQGGGRAGGPVQDIPGDIAWPKISGETPMVGAGFTLRAAYGTAKVAGRALGQGALVKAAPGARVLGATQTVASGPLEVAGTSIAQAILVTGGRFVPQAAANAGRAVLYALVLRDFTYLVVEPAEAPGADSTPAQAPGQSSGTASAPGRDTAPMTDPVDKTPAEAPGRLVDDPAECKKLNYANVAHHHHIFPKEWRQEFWRLGIDIDQWTVTVSPKEHLSKDGLHPYFGWNDEWQEFFDEMPDVGTMTPAQARGWKRRAENLGYRLMIEAGIDRRKLHWYRSSKPSTEK